MVATEIFMRGDIVAFDEYDSELFYFESAIHDPTGKRSRFFIVNIRTEETAEVDPGHLKLVRRTQFFTPGDVVYIRVYPNLGSFTILKFNADGSCLLKSKQNPKAPEIERWPIELLLVSRTTAEIDWVTS